jgi:hypothetical protein
MGPLLEFLCYIIYFRALHRRLANVNKHCWRCYCWFSDHTDHARFSYGDTKLAQHLANNVYLHFASRLLEPLYHIDILYKMYSS